LRLNPPTEVIHSPGFASFARAASVASASAIELAFSRRASRPGRRPSRMMWLWLSMMPGTTVRPRRLMVRAQSPSSEPPPWPTSAKRPFLISTLDTTVSCRSIVWMLPFTSLRLAPALQSSASAQAGAAAAAESAIAQSHTA
jgi:hypothetical protein